MSGGSEAHFSVPAAPPPPTQDAEIVVDDETTRRSYTLSDCIRMSRSSDSEEQLIGARMLSRLSRNARSQSERPRTLRIVQVGGVRALVALLGRAEAVDTQAHACRALFNLSVLPEVRAEISSREVGGRAALIQCMRSDAYAVHLQAVGAIANLATEPGNKTVLVEEGVLDPLLALVRNTNHSSVCHHACRALFALAADDTNKLHIVRAGGLPPLIESLRHHSEFVQQHASGAIANLAIDPDNKAEIMANGGLLPLLRLAHSPSDKVQRQVARALFALAAKSELRTTMVQENALPPLIALLDSDNVEVQRNAAGALGNIAMSDELKAEVVARGALLPLIRLAASPVPAVQRQTARALFVLSAKDEVKDLIVRGNGLRPLVQLTESDPHETQRDAAGALANISIGPQHKRRVAESGAIRPLVMALDCSSAAVQRQAARALFALAGLSENQGTIFEQGGLLPLVKRLPASVKSLNSPRGADLQVQEVHKHAAGALANLATDKSNEHLLVKFCCAEGCALQRLVISTVSPNAEVQRQAIRALANLALRPEVSLLQQRLSGVRRDTERLYRDMQPLLDEVGLMTGSGGSGSGSGGGGGGGGGSSSHEWDDEDAGQGVCRLCVAAADVGASTGAGGSGHRGEGASASSSDGRDASSNRHTLLAHSVVLAASSPKLRAMLEAATAGGDGDSDGDASVPQLELQGSSDVWRRVLRFCYTGDLDLTPVSGGAKAPLSGEDGADDEILDNCHFAAAAEAADGERSADGDEARAVAGAPAQIGSGADVNTASSLYSQLRTVALHYEISDLIGVLSDDVGRSGPRPLGDRLRGLVASESVADVRLMASDGHVFWAHKPVVCSRCPYFHAMFVTSRMREAQEQVAMVPVNTSGAVLRELLTYIYTGELSEVATDNVQLLLGLLAVANEYMLDGLQVMIEMYFACNWLRPCVESDGNDFKLCLSDYKHENDMPPLVRHRHHALVLLQAADALGAARLHALATAFLLLHFEEIEDDLLTPEACERQIADLHMLAEKWQCEGTRVAMQRRFPQVLDPSTSESDLDQPPKRSIAGYEERVDYRRESREREERASAGATVQCPQCGASVRLTGGLSRADAYCTACGSSLGSEEDRQNVSSPGVGQIIDGVTKLGVY